MRSQLKRAKNAERGSTGGYVIHLSSGTAAFAAAAVVGPRHPEDRRNNKPSNPVASRMSKGKP